MKKSRKHFDVRRVTGIALIIVGVVVVCFALISQIPANPCVTSNGWTAPFGEVLRTDYVNDKGVILPFRVEVKDVDTGKNTALVAIPYAAGFLEKECRLSAGESCSAGFGGASLSVTLVRAYHQQMSDSSFSGADLKVTLSAKYGGKEYLHFVPVGGSFVPYDVDVYDINATEKSAAVNVFDFNNGMSVVLFKTRLQEGQAELCDGGGNRLPFAISIDKVLVVNGTPTAKVSLYVAK